MHISSDQPQSAPTPVDESTLVPIEVAVITQALAAMIEPDQSILMCVTKVGNDELLVNIQPAATGDDGSTAICLQVSGSPAEIDEQLASALSSYVPARQYAIQSAREVAKDIKAAADLAREEAAKKAAARKPTPTAAKAPMRELTVTVEPEDATIVATLGGEKHTLESGEPFELAQGKYEIRCTATDCEDNSQVVTIADKAVELSVKLQAKIPSLF